MKFKEQSFTLFAYTNYRAIQGSHSSNHRILSEKVRSAIPLYNRGWVCFLLDNRATLSAWFRCQGNQSKLGYAA